MALPLPAKVPRIIKWYFNKYVWDKFGESQNKKQLFLTFDDGPIPEVTPWVVETLRNYNAKATFFCIGDNVRKHPDVLKMIERDGHTIANHTFNHLNGWKTPLEKYISNTLKAEEILTEVCSNPIHKLVRPPYGKIKKAQAKTLMDQGYKIIMYDIVAYDWEQKITPEQCLNNVLKNAKSGSIIVFHDSLKAEKNMKYALPRVLDKFSKEGYTFEAL